MIARSTKPGVVESIIRGEETGTYVVPGKERLSARKLWLAFGQQPEGRLRIDDGAVRALVRRGSSLLSVGVIDVDGEFAAGAAVEVCDPEGSLVGKGLVSAGSSDVRRWMGKRSGEIGAIGEVIHRDQLVILAK